MATIQEIRQKYPQYSDMSDRQLADALYSKHYSDMDRNDFYGKVGLSDAVAAPAPTQEPAAPKKRTIIDKAEEVADLGGAFMNARALGLGNKIGAGMGAAVAWPFYQAAEAVTGKDLGGDYENLYKTLQGQYSDIEKRAYDKHPVFATMASIGGGAKTFTDLGKLNAAKRLGNWSGQGKGWETVAKKALVASGSGELGYRAYKVGSAEHGKELDALVSGKPWGGIAGGAFSLGGSGVSALINKSPSDAAAKSVIKKFGKKKAEKLFAEQLTKRPDLQEAVKRAGELDEAAKKYGIHLTTAEKLAYGGTDPLLAQQGIIGGNPVTGGRMAQLYADRSGQIEGAYQNIANKLNPAAQSYDDAALAVIEQAKRAKDRLNTQLAGRAAPLYQKAYEANKSVMTPQINRVLNTPFGKKALSRARQTMRNDMKLLGVPTKDLTAQAKQAGIKTGAGVSDGFKLETLDYVKKELDSMYSQAQRKGDTSAMRSLSNLSRTLLKELDDADTTGAYSKARQVYSGQPEKIAERARIGNLADIDELKTSSVGKALMSGTQKTAQRTAETLGPQGSKQAAAAVLRDALETNRGAPESLVRRIAPNDRTAEQLAAYLGNSADDINNVNELSRRVLMGNRLVRAPSPTQERTAAEKLLEGASVAADAKTGGLMSVLRRIGEKFGKQDDPQFYEDMFQLMTTPEGMELVRRIAAEQANALAVIPQQSARQFIVPGGKAAWGATQTPRVFTPPQKQ